MSRSPGFGALLGEHIELAINLRRMEIVYDPVKCQGVWECYEVCPVGCWIRDHDRGVAVFYNAERCIACNACVLQCPEGAIEMKVPRG